MEEKRTGETEETYTIPQTISKWSNSWKEYEYNELKTTTAWNKDAICDEYTWMKAKLIIFSANRLIKSEEDDIKKRHAKKTQDILNL